MSSAITTPGIQHGKSESDPEMGLLAKNRSAMDILADVPGLFCNAEEANRLAVLAAKPKPLILGRHLLRRSSNAMED
jgi:hypothetical protein